MKVKSEDEWQLFNAEIAADSSGIAEPFRDFVVAWAEAAEELMRKAEIGGDYYWPIECLRQTLRSVEAEVGRWTIGFVGQALVVLGTHWAPAGNGDVNRFFESMTPIEQNLFADVVETKLVELAKVAEAAAEDAPFTQGEIDELLRGRDE